MSRKRILPVVLSLSLALGLCPAAFAAETETGPVHTIVLSSTQGSDGTWTHTAACDGTAVTEYDYTWHADPSTAHDDVKNAPAIYYTGTEPTGDEAVYIAHDIQYFPELNTDGFVKQRYNGETEWCYYYTAEGYTDYIFGTLPVQGSTLPTAMMHTETEAYENAVLHITQAGTYSLTGDWHGQIWIDLGEDAATDPTAKVTILLNGVDVTCTVASSLVFANVYECDTDWESQTAWSSTVDTTNAGANVILADGTTNNFSGTNVYRLLKTKFKSDTDTGTGAAQKKYLKIDGAFYSYMSMNITGQTAGTGVLNLTAGYEGLDTEHHLTLNGGTVNITSQDDGINVNEDKVSVVTVNDGTLHIVAGLGAEGDGIDSNGYLVINGGVVISCAKPMSDSGLDSDCGSYVNGGTVVATGSTMDWAESDSKQVTMNLQFAASQASDEAIIITDTQGKVVFAYDPDKDETTGSYNRGYQGAVLSAPTLEVGESYYVYVGGDVTGTETNGLYDVSTVTEFSAEAKQQSYTGTDVGGFGPGGMTPPDFADGERPEPPDGSDGMTPPDFNGSTPPERPDGTTPPDFDGSNPPELPDGMTPPWQTGTDTQTGPASVVFTMTDKVNAFSGVADYTGSDGTVGSFTDVSDSAYYADAVQWAVENQVTTGTSATTFSPDTACTRAQAVTFLWRAAGSPEPASDENPFTDVSGDAYYYQAVLWAVEQGITNGTGETTFSPDATCTRAQIVTMLWRQTDRTAAADTTAFTDVSADAYYAQAVQWAVAQSITNGTSDTTFSPDNACTRAQIVTFLYRQST